jgi:hypothetical protein
MNTYCFNPRLALGLYYDLIPSALRPISGYPCESVQIWKLWEDFPEE